MISLNTLRHLAITMYNRAYALVFGAKRYRYLWSSIREVKPKIIVEIGTWRGERAIRMIEEASLYRKPEDVIYIGFDLFEGLDKDMFKEEVSKYPLTSGEVRSKLDATGADIRLIVGDTKKTLPLYINDLPKADFVFIDGGHSIETIKSDWESVAHMMHDETVVIFDDYWRNRTDAGAKPIVDRIDRQLYDVEILPRIDQFENQFFGHLEIQFAKVRIKR